MTDKRPTFAVIGHPISHSRSPMVHRAFGQQFGIDLTYGRIDARPDEFEAVVLDFFTKGGTGLNVTVPHKESAWQMAKADLSARAHAAAAVNTLWMQDGRLHGCNTDGIGLLMDLERLGMLSYANRILVLGAGGAARGVLGPLLSTGCKTLCIANRTPSRAQALIDNWLTNHPENAPQLHACGLDDPRLCEPWDLIINATSSSLGAQPIALPDAAIGSQTSVYDMMYAAQPTTFLEMSQQNGARQTADGLGMLVSQAAQSFQIWHGLTPQVEPVIALVREHLHSNLR